MRQVSFTITALRGWNALKRKCGRGIGTYATDGGMANVYEDT